MRTWWFDARPAVWRGTVESVVLVLALWGLSYWKDPPLGWFLFFILPVTHLARWSRKSAGRFAALADGALITIDDYGHATVVPLATAILRNTPNGWLIDWEDEPTPTPLPLPRFPAPELLAEAIETARTGGAPSSSRELALRLQVVPVLTPLRWIRLAYVVTMVLVLPLIAIRRLSFLLLLPGALLPWLDSLARKAPWAAITPQGLWVLQFNQEPVWIPRSAVTAIHYKWGGLDSLVRTTHAGFPTLALGIRPQDLHRLLPAPAAWLEEPKPM